MIFGGLKWSAMARCTLWMDEWFEERIYGYPKELVFQSPCTQYYMN